ncbi:MAG: FMN-binding protein [Clostridia bacterium]|nr:FMN-binding protein [Clostridia bacterium]
MKKSIRSIIVLVSICAVVSILMALTNSVTAPIIAENDAKNANAALLQVLPDGGSFETVDMSAYTLPSTVTAVYRASNGGCVVQLTTSGYSSGMVIMCGINPDGTVSGSKILSSSETPSIGGEAAERFAPTLNGKTAGDIETVEIISGATKTTAAYRSAVKDALNTALILGGASIDTRTEEEILQDNLDSALPTAQGKFTKHFFVEVIEGIDAIYTADNNAGHVCVLGEKFVGVDNEGNALTECTEDEAQTVKTAIETINATATELVDLSAYEGLPSQLIQAQKSATGNYIIEIKAAGYGIVGGDEYHPASGEYIMVRVSITADGRIIDCLTVSQAETEGIGDACAKESFYGQFDGKTEADYTEIDAISGATLTTNGYKQAIGRAFDCVKIFEGVNS